MGECVFACRKHSVPRSETSWETIQAWTLVFMSALTDIQICPGYFKLVAMLYMEIMNVKCWCSASWFIIVFIMLCVILSWRFLCWFSKTQFLLILRNYGSVIYKELLNKYVNDNCLCCYSFKLFRFLRPIHSISQLYFNCTFTVNQIKSRLVYV